MATLDDNKKLLDDQSQGAQTQSADLSTPQTAGPAAAPTSGSSGVSTAGIGPGGQGWTNIQSYLNANQGSTGTSDYANKQIGGAFSADQKSLTDTSNQAKQQSQDESNKIIGVDKASQLIGQGQGQQVQGALGAQYAGPTSYNYALSDQTQNYGSNLGTDKGWNAVLSGLYNQAAGGQMNQGQLDLQHQLDANNPSVAQARQDLTNQYSGLQNSFNTLVPQTDAAVKANQAAFNTSQSGLKTGLENERNNDFQSAQNYSNDPYFTDPGNYTKYNQLSDVLGLSQMPVNYTGANIHRGPGSMSHPAQPVQPVEDPYQPKQPNYTVGTPWQT